MKSKRKINTCVIGVGNMGRYHARTYFKLNNVNLEAVSDINEKTGRKVAKEFNCKYYKDYNEMLVKENLDAVSITVPTKLHKKVALDMIKTKKHVLIEKPIASTIKEAKEIIKAAKKAGVKLTVGHIERFNPAVQELKRIIQGGKLGQIVSIIAKRVGVFPPQVRDTSVIIDLAIHDIDIFNYLINQQPTSVFVKGRKVLRYEQDDSAEILLSYNDISCFIQVNWITPIKIRTLSVTGSKGYVELNYITQKLEMFQSKYTREFDSFGEFVKFGEPIKKEIKTQKKRTIIVRT